jgi:hypothetical protein
MWPHRKKSQGFKSGEGGGHGIGPFLSNNLAGALAFLKFIFI